MNSLLFLQTLVTNATSLNRLRHGLLLLMVFAGFVMPVGCKGRRTDRRATVGAQATKPAPAPKRVPAAAPKPSQVEPEDGRFRPVELPAKPFNPSIKAAEMIPQQDALDTLFAPKEEKPQATPEVPSTSEEDAELEQTEEEEGVPPFVELAPVGSDKFPLLIESIYRKKPFDYLVNEGRPKDFRETGFYGPIRGGAPWRESKRDESYAVVALEKMTLRFEHPEATEPDFEGVGSFNLTVELFDEPFKVLRGSTGIAGIKRKDVSGYSMVMRHSYPESREGAAGFRVSPEQDKQLVFVVDGKEGSSLIVMAAKATQHGPKGILLCPYDYDRAAAQRGYFAFKPTKYELRSIEVDAKGIVQNKLNSGFGAGVAESLVQVTDNLARSKRWHDASDLTFPSSSVYYRPREGKLVIPPAAGELLTFGIRAEGSLLNSFEHYAARVMSEVITMQQVELRSSLPLAYKKRTWKMLAGNCYAFVKETRFGYEYKKLELPSSAAKSDTSIKEVEKRLQ